MAPEPEANSEPKAGEIDDDDELISHEEGGEDAELHGPPSGDGARLTQDMELLEKVRRKKLSYRH